MHTSVMKHGGVGGGGCGGVCGAEVVVCSWEVGRRLFETDRCLGTQGHEGTCTISHTPVATSCHHYEYANPRQSSLTSEITHTHTHSVILNSL